MIRRMPKIQTAQSHTAIDLLFHRILIPFFVANFIVAIVQTVKTWPHDIFPHLWSILFALALILLTFKVRIYALKLQDRVIRLEESVRIAALAPAADLSKLTTKQFIALRFASDAELPALVLRAISENLDTKAIKGSIVGWRSDDARV